MLTVNRNHPKRASKPSNTVLDSFAFCGVRGRGEKQVRTVPFLKFSYMSKIKECKRKFYEYSLT